MKSSHDLGRGPQARNLDQGSVFTVVSSSQDLRLVVSFDKSRCLQVVKSSRDLGLGPQPFFDIGSEIFEFAEVRAVPPVVLLQAVLTAI